MTVRELYKWAEKSDALDLDIEIKYRDYDGSISGTDDPYPQIEEAYKFYNTKSVVSL